MNLTKPKYTKTTNDLLYQQLRMSAFALVRHLEPRRRKIILLKALIFPFAYFVSYSALLFWGAHELVFYTCYFLMGLLLVFIFLNSIHEAVHGSLFRQQKHNAAYLLLFDLMGANSYIWKLRHVRFHHNFPNVQGWDTDIEQSRLARVFPAGKFETFHRYQHLYLPLLYPFYLANWLLVRDFKDFFKKTVRCANWWIFLEKSIQNCLYSNLYSCFTFWCCLR